MTTQRSSVEEKVDVEKMAVIHQERLHANGLTSEDADFLANFSDEARNKVLRKVDWRLIPMLLILYLITYVDKTNIGNAQIEGLNKSLHLTGTQYNVALSIFFIPYVLAGE